jgi:hypothetical protein
MDNKNAGKFAIGTQFMGNVNKAMMEVVGFKEKYHGIRSKVAIIKELKTDKKFVHGLDNLERCNVTILDNNKGGIT